MKLGTQRGSSFEIRRGGQCTNAGFFNYAHIDILKQNRC